MTAVPSFSVASTVALLVVLIASLARTGESFVNNNNNINKAHSTMDTSIYGIMDKMGEMFAELDAFVDDATSRRLGAGASFYGKRKSNFYGEDDKGRKQDRTVPDPTEDYQGPTSTGLFKWMEDEDGQLRPVSRRKEKNLERNPNFWDRVYASEESKE